MRARSAAVARLAVLVALVGAFASSPAQAASTARIAPSLHPDRLGARSALRVSLAYPGGLPSIPPPIVKTSVRLPAGMSLDVPSLRSCSAARLLDRGASGCPPRSQLGQGHALVEAQSGPGLVKENVALRVFLGPPENLSPTFNVLAVGSTPVDELLVIGGTVHTDTAPYGERLTMSIPPVPSLPGEPPVSLVSLTLSIGPRAGDKRRGLPSVRVPARCPAGGFPFAAELTYLGGARSSSRARIPCPPSAHAARTIELNETGHLHLTSRHNFTLNEEGTASGTVKGTIYVHLTAVSSSRVRAEVNIYAPGGSISAKGLASYRRGSSSASFSGTISLARGSGSYAKVHGSGLHFSGTIAESKNDAIVVHLSGRVSS